MKWLALEAPGHHPCLFLSSGYILFFLTSVAETALLCYIRLDPSTIFMHTRCMAAIPTAKNYNFLLGGLPQAARTHFACRHRRAGNPWSHLSNSCGILWPFCPWLGQLCGVTRLTARVPVQDWAKVTLRRDSSRQYCTLDMLPLLGLPPFSSPLPAFP